MDAFATLPAATAKFLSLGINDLAESTSTDTRALDQFLASVERKAFRIAQIALRHEEDALDAVQDAMLRLVRSYARRPREEWPPLFYRILENCIRDLQRRRAVRARVMSWMPWSGQDESAAVTDPLEQLPDAAPGPAAQAQADETLQALEVQLAALPARQRQAFLLRSFEGLDVAATARAMGCSAGSVKTHYFRAVQTLRSALGEFWS
ncbi:MAG TPA: RNA polymerase sigma factor [Steroidobacteraceae bacterium]|jgi:RNA polymerase sigma-70 factor, ECF subfamily|nr:RNA polymerase sigma factor [Steroidobacteraceae bacterium]